MLAAQQHATPIETIQRNTFIRLVLSRFLDLRRNLGIFIFPPSVYTSLHFQQFLALFLWNTCRPVHISVMIGVRDD